MSLADFRAGKPGIYDGIPRADYDELRAVNQSYLKAVFACPEKAQHGPGWEEKTDDLVFGNLVHTLLFEPDSVEARYVVADKPNLRTKIGKAEWAEVHESAEAAGKVVVSTGDRQRAGAMAAKVWSDDTARKLLKRGGAAEVSCVWRYPGAQKGDAGLCKGRLDWFSDDRRTVLDLKTAASSEPYKFAYSALRWGYYFQAAFYQQAIYELAGTVPSYRIVAVEKERPYVVTVFKPGPIKMAEAAVNIETAWHLLRACERSGRWPGYVGDEVVNMDDYHYRNRRYDDDGPEW